MKPITNEELEKRKRTNKKLIKYGFLPLIGIIILIFIFSSNENPEPSPVVINNAMNGSVFQVENYLKKNLKDPSSYEGIEWSKVVIDSVNGKPEKYMVRHKYRAKNSFGGYTVENKIFYLDSTGVVYNSLDE